MVDGIKAPLAEYWSKHDIFHPLTWYLGTKDDDEEKEGNEVMSYLGIDICVAGLGLGGENLRKASKFNQEGDQLGISANAQERKGNTNKGPKLRNQLWWQIRSSNSRLANFMQISLRR